jgi:hypothetical protein
MSRQSPSRTTAGCYGGSVHLIELPPQEKIDQWLEIDLAGRAAK